MRSIGFEGFGVGFRARMAFVLTALLALGLLFAPGSAAAAATSVKIGTATLNSTSPYYHNGADGAQGTANSTEADAHAAFDPDTGTLTLKGLNISIDNEPGISASDDLTIVLDAGTTNTVKGNYKGGVAVGGTDSILTIQGAGKLNATGGGSAIDSTNSYGVYCEGGIDLSGNGAITATSGTATGDKSSSYGIYAKTGDLKKSGTGTVTATSGTAAIDSNGICASNSEVVISDGVVNATSDKSKYSYGVFAKYDVAVTGGTLNTTGGNLTDKDKESHYCSGIFTDRGYIIISHAAQVAAKAGYSFFNSQGICAINGDVQISGSAEVTAIGGVVDRDYSYGVYAGSVSLSGGTLTAAGDSAGNDSFGVFATYSASLTGGTLTATGGTVTGIDSRSYGVYVESYSFTASGSATVTARGGPATVESCGICARLGVVEISGTAKVTATTDTSQFSYGVYALNSIDFNGGTLNATGGNVDEEEKKSQYCYGIFSLNEDISISNTAIVIAKAGYSTTDCQAICAQNGNVQISDSAEVTATGGNSAYNSNGVYAGCDISLSGGTLTATGGTAEDYSYGIYADNNVTISNTAKVTATGGTATLNDSAGVYGDDNVVVKDISKLYTTGGKAVMSYGIITRLGDVKISDTATVEAMGGEARWSDGIRVRLGKVEISSNTNVTAKGGSPTSVGRSCGVCASTDTAAISIASGTFEGADYGLYCEDAATVTITGGTFKSTGANARSIQTAGTLNIQGAATLTSSGGNIHLASDKLITITGPLTNNSPYTVSTDDAPSPYMIIAIATTPADADASKFELIDIPSGYELYGDVGYTGYINVMKVYSVAFHSNDGTETMQTQKFFVDVAQALSANTFTRENYTFEGWAESATGDVVYADEEEVVNLATSGTFNLYAVWKYNPPPALYLYDENGNPIPCDSLQDALDMIDKGLRVKEILLNSDQTIEGDLTILKDVKLDLNGFKLSCGNPVNSQGATMIISEGQQLTIGGSGDIGALEINGALIVNGNIMLDGVTMKGDGYLLVQSGSVTLNGTCSGINIRLAALQAQPSGAKSVSIPKIIIDASFRVRGVTGKLLLPGECYEVGFKVLHIEPGADMPNFNLGNAPDKTWYITSEGLLASRAKSASLILDYLVIGKNTKINTANLLPWKYEGAVTWESGDDKVLKVVKNGKKRLVKGVDLGSTTLKATFADGHEQTIPVTVVVKKEAVSSVGGPDAIKLKRGETRTLTPKVKPAGAVDKKLFWLSSDETIATVENGLITGVETGVCRVVVVAASGKRNVIKVTVTKKSVTEATTVKPVNRIVVR